MIHAIHVHPHDIRDESAERVVRNITELAGIRTIIVEVSTLEERHPYPRGVLPHNPLHSVVVSRATLEIPLSRPLWKDLAVRPVLSPEALAGNDYLGALTGAASNRGATIVPWLKGLNGAFENDVAGCCVRTLEREPVPTWLCPSHPETAEYVIALLDEVLLRYPAPAVLLDRMRYPDWSGATVKPERILTCFCDTCCKRMAEEGLDVPILERGLFRILESSKQMQAGHWNSGELLPAPIAAAESREIQKWLDFRCRRITHLVAAVSRRFRKHQCPSRQFWLNLWSPSFSVFMGQDYQALGPLCDGAKHFPYHRLGGGADLSGLVSAITAAGQGDVAEQTFQAIMGLLQLPYRLSFQQFQESGLPVAFVGRETAAGKRAFGPGKKIFSGIQIWNTPDHEIRTASQSALEGGADGFFFYCYGWATLEALETVGQIIAFRRDAGDPFGSSARSANGSSGQRTATAYAKKPK